MFQPPIFKEERQDVLSGAIAKHPLATLVCSSAEGLIANHLPMLFAEAEGVLQAHLSRGNDLIKHYEDGVEALAIFQGPSHYITPSWYPAKQEHGKVVPTYNYMTVHVRGRLTFHEDSEWLLTHLNALTNKQEAGRTEPWKVSDAPEKFVERQLKGIYGLQFEVSEMVGKWKMSQNQPAEARAGVVEGLREDADYNAVETAEAVEGAS